MFIATIVVSLALATVLATSTVRKLSGRDDSLHLRDRLGLSPGLWNTIGALEAAAVAGLLAGLAVAPLGVAAAAGSALLMAGAVVAHLRRGLTGSALASPVVMLLAAVAAAVLRSMTA